MEGWGRLGPGRTRGVLRAGPLSLCTDSRSPGSLKEEGSEGRPRWGWAPQAICRTPRPRLFFLGWGGGQKRESQKGKALAGTERFLGAPGRQAPLDFPGARTPGRGLQGLTGVPVEGCRKWP